MSIPASIVNLIAEVIGAIVNAPDQTAAAKRALAAARHRAVVEAAKAARAKR
jgi:hypothetical protein